MADPGGRQLLKRSYLIAPGAKTRVLIAEGVPDFLTWASWFGDTAEDAPAVLGIVAGSWTPEIANRIPNDAEVFIRTHPDSAGSEYAEKIIASLMGRCRLLAREETAGAI
jgi:hypothetical protein